MKNKKLRFSFFFLSFVFGVFYRRLKEKEEEEEEEEEKLLAVVVRIK